ncbi:glycosyltransferase [Clostridium vincentii]|uniref:D-inositol 3-phosphate glycosyltransferase n=1 Tax=Clostridium vincentii TaxID=52704 RepID=A0A2T0BJU5_9CLOT|nr:glycosyltransferase [Clostridium vincentii]PRR84082.1 D-inositol 3-phosphate glycosyltransferase [Clostridium vincentii]
MRIFQINSHYNQSGAGKIVACIHRELKRHGYGSMVAYGRGKVTNEDGIYRIGSKFELAFEGFNTRFIGINGFTSWNATKKLVMEIDKFCPDVIHLHGLHGYYLNYKILFDYINRKNIPCVWTFHDCHAFSGNCGYHYECDKWKTSCYECQHLREYPTSYWLDHTNWMWEQKKNLFTQTDNKIIVSPSEWMTDDAKQSFFGKYNCITVNNGVDTENVFYKRDKNECRKKYGFSVNDKIILGIAFGFDDPRKGVKYIIQMAHDFKDQNIKFILIGWNKKNNYLIDKLSNILTIPFTNNQDELAEYYSLADAFLLPSLAENYATVAIESMACGTPVVGFDVGGVAEQLTGRKGITVPAADQLKFNAAVLSILDGTAQLCNDTEIEDYTKGNNSILGMVEKYLEIYYKASHIGGN